MSNQVYISQDANEVNLVNTDKQLIITEVGNGTSVNVTQPITSVIEVATMGPQGQAGLTGPQGPSGSLQPSSSGSFGITGSLILSGSNPLTVVGPTILSGSLNVTQGITGSLFGTSSYSINALSASYSLVATSASYALTASYAANVPVTASYALSASVAVSSSFSSTASYVENAQSASYVLNAVSASYATQADNAKAIDIYSFASPVESYLLMSNIVATTGVAVGGDSDLRYNSSTNVLTVPNLSATNITGSLLGTASFAVSASYLIGQSPTSSYALTASYLNPLNQDVSLTGNLTINGTASINYLNVAYESASIIYSSGSNQFGDAANDTQTLYGTVRIPTGSLTVTGSIASTAGFTGSLFGTASYTPNLDQVTTVGNTTTNAITVDKLTVSTGTTKGVALGGTSIFEIANQPTYTQLGITPSSGNKSAVFLFYPSGTANASVMEFYHKSTLGTNERVIFKNNNGLLQLGGDDANIPIEFIGTNVALMKIFATGNVAIGTTTDSARLTIKGSGATSSTTSLLVQNSSGATGLTVFDNGNVSVGSATNSFYQLYGNGAWFNAGSIYTSLLYTDTITPSAGGSTNFYANINNFKIGTTSTATTSAVFEIVSTTKGFLPPRTNLTSNISAPAQGLQTYITASATEGLYYYNSGSYQGWTRVLNDSGSQAISGSLTANNGNLIVNSGSIFVNTSNTIKALGYTLAPFYVGVTNGKNIGFTYNGAATIISLDDGNTAVQPLQFRASSFNFTDTSGLRISNTGYGSTPSAMLHVVGSGTTSSTTSLLVQNSSATSLFELTDNGQINMAASGGRIKFIGPNSGASGNGIFWGVSATGTTYGSITLSSGGGQLDYFTDTSYFHRFLTLNNVEVMRLGTGYTANIGIRTTTPQAGLHIGINTIISGSAGTNTLSIGTLSSGSALTVYKSGSTVVDIQGSQGQLFSVIDALSGSLMSVNDISGLPILEVFSDDRVVMGTYGNAGLIVTGSDVQISASLFGTRQTGSLAVGSTLLYTINTGSYTAGFFDYFVNSGSNYRAGNIMAVFGAGTYKFTDLATPDIGSTTNLQFSMSMAGASAQLYASASSAGWTVKTTFRTI